MSSETPDWNVAIMDGQPEVVANLAGVAELVRKCPLGPAEGLRRIRHGFTAEQYARLVKLVNE